MRKINSIFIVDDDPITVFGIKKLLGKVVEFDTLDTYANGKLALNAIQERISEALAVPDVIFLDINMPIMDGWQFLEEFLALPIEQKIRVNIITSSIDSADVGNWEKYRKLSHHLITFNNKPVKKDTLEQITKTA